MTTKQQFSALDLEALEFHSRGVKGKLSVCTHKPLKKQKDLSLAYSPGVAAPCIEIARDPSLVFEYTSKGNFVAVITNGTAVLGLGNLGPLASKPVMEGKAVLFKRFADIDAIDVEVDTTDPEVFIQVVKHIALTWGGINLEDIKAPECFVIEQRLKELVDVPVFHDDQHGTAIVAAAGLLNAAHITNRKFEEIKIVVNGAGAAAIACIELLKSMGVKHENVILCDTRGVIYEGRTDGMNIWKERHANKTKNRSLAEALIGADVFLGLSVKGAVTQDMIMAMNHQPIIFAMANPDPEITPEEVENVRPDAITATGRSDYHNQVNNVMCFPYIFRGALDTQTTTINDEMKIAAVYAIAKLARQDISDEVASAYPNHIHQYGPKYIIPTPFDSRLMQEVPSAVAEAAMKTGVARKNIIDLQAYKRELVARLSRTSKITNSFYAKLENNQKTVIFAHGSEEQMVKAAIQWQTHKYGRSILIGKEQKIASLIEKVNPDVLPSAFTIIDPKQHKNTQKYVDDIYRRLQRAGYSYDECVRLILRNSTVFAAEMLKHKEADAMVSGLTEGYLDSLNNILLVVDKVGHKMLFGLSLLLMADRVLFMADTAINELPSAQELAQIAIQTAEAVKDFGYIPRIAFIAASTFGHPPRKDAHKIKEVISILDRKGVDFEYDGELAANVAINADLLKKYPFCKLSGAANILITPELSSAHIASKLIEELGHANVMGPILYGLDESIQIAKMGATSTDILDAAAIAATKSCTNSHK